MYNAAAIRIALILLVGIIARYFTVYVDDWLWRGVRDLIGGRVPYLVQAVAVIIVLADSAGAFCPRVRIAVRQPARWALGVGVVAVVALWWLRVPNWLGDYNGIDKTGLPWCTIEPAEPLGVFTSYYALHWGHALGLKNSTAIASVSTLFGASAVAAMFLWAVTVSVEWPLVFAMLASCGFTILFYGYPEKGTPKSVALVCWYVYFTTRALRDRRTLWLTLSNLSLSLACLMHGSALCWLPAHAWYVWRRTPWRRSAAGIAAFVIPGVLMALYVKKAGVGVIAGGYWGNIAAPWQWFKRYCVTNCGYDFWSTIHLMDIINCLLLLSPFALLCLPEALARTRDVTERWLALGSLGWLFLSLTWFPVFGYVADWDIFAGTPLVISFFAVLIGVRQMAPAAFRRLAFAWVAGSLLHTFSWWHFFHLPL